MKIVTAIDFSTATEAVLKATKLYAKRLNAEVFLIHVEPDAMLVPDLGNTALDVAYETSVDDTVEHVRLNKDAKALTACGVKVTPVLCRGYAAEKIVKEAVKQKAELIIIGSHGHGVLHNVLIGSVGAAVLKKSKTPVMLIPIRE